MCVKTLKPNISSLGPFKAKHTLHTVHSQDILFNPKFSKRYAQLIYVTGFSDAKILSLILLFPGVADFMLLLL
jgi:hypothetical protein